MSISNQLLFCAANNINDVYFFVRRSNLTHLFTESLPGKSRLCHKEKADFDFALEAIVRGREAIMGSLCLEMASQKNVIGVDFISSIKNNLWNVFETCMISV